MQHSLLEEFYIVGGGSESSPVAIDALPALEQQAAFNVSSVLVLSCNVGSSICSELQVRSVREVKRR